MGTSYRMLVLGVPEAHDAQSAKDMAARCNDHAYHGGDHLLLRFPDFCASISLSASLRPAFLRRTLPRDRRPQDWTIDIAAQRARLTAPPAPLFQQRQSVLTKLVDAWDLMTADTGTDARGDLRQQHRQRRGVNRLEPCEDWRP